jgi:hypothetical protein
MSSRWIDSGRGASWSLLALAALGLGSLPARAWADDAMSACITSSEQGLELRKQEKLLDARKTLAACATTKCPDEIRSVCEQRITEINAAIPTVIFDVTDAAGAPQTAVKVTVDGISAAIQFTGRGMPFDPGLHTFRFEVAGQSAVEKKLLLKEGDRERRESVVIGAAPAAAPAVAPAAATATPPPAAPGSASPPSPPSAGAVAGATPSSGSTQKTLGLVSGGVGVAGLVIGGIFGAMASSKWSSAKSDCGAICPANAPAQQEKNDAQSAATVSTIGVVGGAVLVAAGAVLFFTAPSGATRVGSLRVTPSAGPGAAGLTLQGGF